MLGFERPIYRIDTVGTGKAVMNTFLIAVNLFATKHEWHSLRGENNRLCQLVEFHALFFRNVGYRTSQTVYQAHIVVARYIADGLCRLDSPGALAIVHFAIIYLGMFHSTYNSKFDTHFVSRQRSEECRWMGVVELATGGIAR